MGGGVESGGVVKQRNLLYSPEYQAAMAKAVSA